jgi:hypothetical protein
MAKDGGSEGGGGRWLEDDAGALGVVAGKVRRGRRRLRVLS